MLVPDVNTKAVTDTVELSDHVSQFLDSLDLLLEVFAFDKVSQLRIIISIGQLVQVEKRLVDIYEGTTPIITCSGLKMRDDVVYGKGMEVKQ